MIQGRPSQLDRELRQKGKNKARLEAQDPSWLKVNCKKSREYDALL
jgi:hypothetical protein